MHGVALPDALFAGAVIDFGCCGVGDPGPVTWPSRGRCSPGRAVRRSALGLPLDTATWARGRGWALWKALITLAEHRTTDPTLAAASLHVVREVLAEHATPDPP